MAIKTDVSFYEFRDAMKQDEYASWSNEAISAIFDYLYDLSEDIGEDIELDTVALRCEWNEIHIQDLWNEYSNIFERYGLTEDDDADDYNRQVSIIEEHTTVLDIRRADHMGHIVLQAF